MDKKYLLRIISYAALALAALVLIADIGYQIASSMVEQVETVLTERIDTGENIRTEGFLFRSESVLEYQTNGHLGYTVEDGDRVTVGSSVARVYNSAEETERLLGEIDRIERNLELIGEAESVKGIYTVVSADQRIAALRREIDDAAVQGSPVGSRLGDELLVMLYVRDLKSGKSLDETKSALAQERDSLKASLGAAGGTVTSNKIGYFYSNCDGYEGKFDADDLDSATVDDFAKLLDGSIEPTPNDHAVGKIVTDHNWYLICVLDAQAARGMSQSEHYSIAFGGDNDRVIDMELDRLVYEYGNDKSALVFRTSNMPEDFSYTRFQTVTIEQESFNGYRVPIGAVRSLGGISGVYILHGSVVEFREVRPINVQDGMVTVDADAEPSGEYKMLQYYDRIIVRGKELYVGKIID